MLNPYSILELSQNATEAEIARSQINALRKRKHSLKEIAGAQTALRNPATRLAADFTFPILETPETVFLTIDIQPNQIDLSGLDPDKYDSLR